MEVTQLEPEVIGLVPEFPAGGLEKIADIWKLSDCFQIENIGV